MNFESLLMLPAEKPVCIGAGLVALDIVIVDGECGPPRLWAGGSCGNVMSILSYLGWTAVPVTRLRNDNAAQRIMDDLVRWKVRTDFIMHQPTGSTPLIVERVTTTKKGRLKHRFEWFCPFCGSRLPSYRPVPSRFADEVASRLPASDVFYFDRANRFNLELARSCKNLDALVFFEPQRFEDSSLFQDCLNISDVVKYSADRIPAGLDGLGSQVEIQTMGTDGLRIRFPGSRDNWFVVEPEHVRQFKDAAGSGDWCSAGIIHYLKVFKAKSWIDDVSVYIEACRLGQVLAALNCSFEGARGCMYSISFDEFIAEVEAMWGRGCIKDVPFTTPQGSWDLLRLVCPGCIELGNEIASNTGVAFELSL